MLLENMFLLICNQKSWVVEAEVFCDRRDYEDICQGYIFIRFWEYYHYINFGCSVLLVMFILDLTNWVSIWLDFNCWSCCRSLSTPDLQVSVLNDMNWLFWNRWCRWFSLVAMMKSEWGGCQIGVCLHGASDDLVTVSVSHQAARVEDKVMFL